MELIERYVYAVVKHLPQKSRDDIERELRSIIMDAIEEKTQGGQPTEAEIAEVLKELGSPSKMARNYYREGSYVIGPRFYDLYLLVLKIALVAALVGVTVGFVVNAVTNGVAAQDFFKLLGSLISALFSTVGIITLGFAITERINSDAPEIFKEKSHWDPRDLPKVPGKFEIIKPSDIVVGLLFTVIFFVLLNFYPHVFGIYSLEGKNLNFVSFMDFDALKHYLPLLNILFGLSFLKLILLMADGKYKLYTFILEILGALGVIAVAVMMLTGPSLVNAVMLENSHPENLIKVINGLYRGVLSVMIIVGIFDVARYSIKMIRSFEKAI